jgi:hypothetical protein
MNDRTFELKRLSRDAIDAALKRALHYRYLNQPHLAESICRDILDAAPDHEEARVTLIMSLCDQFGTADSMHVPDVLAIASSLSEPYDRAYYCGLVCERRAEAALLKGGPVAGAIAYDWFLRAMDRYAEAEPLRPAGNDDALLRWNTCARTLNTHRDVRPREEEPQVEMLE